jgi:SAM-dependent methyltransferase
MLRRWTVNLARIKRNLSAAFLPGKAPHFYLDSPHVTPGKPHEATSPLHVSGWVIPPAGRAVRALEVLIEGQLVARTSGRGYRPRVARVLPGRAGALRSRFSAEVVLDRWMDRTAEMTVVVDYGEDPYVLAKIPLRVERRVGEEPRRERSFPLEDLLACPDCHASELVVGPDRVRCNHCGAAYDALRGTPLFAAPGIPIPSRLLETHFTHPYSQDSEEIIHRCKEGVVLDFGAGHPHPDRWHPHVLLHEAVHYNQIDVVSVTPRLPYRDNCFDAIISQAVFEHIPRPWEVASELHRVLKPGGEIHIDTAFMQPFHSDPNHFFNMTLSGLREIFRPFREVSAGVKPYQLPSFGLRMQLGVMLEHMAAGPWRHRMQALLGELERDGPALDTALDPEGQTNLAAGVFFHGAK